MEYLKNLNNRVPDDEVRPVQPDVVKTPKAPASIPVPPIPVPPIPKTEPVNNPNRHDACVKEMYSCGRCDSKVPMVSNIVGTLFITVLVGFIVYRFVNRPERLALSKVLAFASDQEIFKMFVSLLLLTNIRTLSNSFIANIVLPLLKPILPFLSCNLKFRIGLFCLNAGEFISDLLVFGINLSLIYVVFAVIY